MYSMNDLFLDSVGYQYNWADSYPYYGFNDFERYGDLKTKLIGNAN